MQPAIDLFRQNLSRAKHLVVLARTLGAMTTAAVDLSDLFRAALVMGVSALDHYVHDIVRLGMLEIHSGGRPLTDGYKGFRVPLGAVATGISAPGTSAWLEASIRDIHGWATFQQPDKIAEAVRLISSVKLWDQVALRLATDAGSLKTQLKAIVDRRNKIAHEADADVTSPGAQWPISDAMVDQALDTISSIAEAMFAVL